MFTVKKGLAAMRGIISRPDNEMQADPRCVERCLEFPLYTLIPSAYNVPLWGTQVCVPYLLPLEPEMRLCFLPTERTDG